MNDATRESRVRGKLRRQGYLLRKDRVQSYVIEPGGWVSQRVDHRGIYRIVEADRNVVVAGERYDLGLEEVEAFAATAQ